MFLHYFITPGWELEPSQPAGGWPLLSVLEVEPLSARRFVATGRRPHIIITQSDKLEAFFYSASQLHFNMNARLDKGLLSPDLWNGDFCGQARDHETWGLVSWASNNDNNDNNNSVWKIPYFFIYFLRPSLRLQCNVLSNLMNNYFYFRLLYIFCNKAFRFGPIWSGCMLKRWVCRASLFLNFSSHTLQRKGALTTSWTDLSLVLPAPAHTVLLISSRHSVTWHTRDQWHVG